jgi:DNA-binding response OmpR family regulator
MNTSLSTQSPVKIILLEDDNDSRAAMAALFCLEGFDVREAFDAASFANCTNDFDAQAIIFDLQLADGSFGPDLVAAYQAKLAAEQKPPAKLIALSGSSRKLLDQPLPCRVDHRFQKPVDFDRLAALLKC